MQFDESRQYSAHEISENQLRRQAALNEYKASIDVPLLFDADASRLGKGGLFDEELEISEDHLVQSNNDEADRKDNEIGEIHYPRLEEEHPPPHYGHLLTPDETLELGPRESHQDDSNDAESFTLAKTMSYDCNNGLHDGIEYPSIENEYLGNQVHIDTTQSAFETQDESSQNTLEPIFHETSPAGKE